MPHKAALVLLVSLACWAASNPGQSRAASPEFNPLRTHPVAIGPEANRLIVGFRAAANNAVIKTQILRRRSRAAAVTQAQTTAADMSSLAQRVGLAMARSRQVTPSIHVMLLPKTLYGAEVAAVLDKLRADNQVKFADIDQRRYPHALSVTPNDPLFQPTPGVASGQWYMNTPSPTPVLLEGGVQTTDLSATDAISAWGITTGSSGLVIADVDTGVRFDHPDLMRAGFGGRLLPGYDFVGEDYNPNKPYNPLGTFLKANDGDGWDPDPSDPGDWLSSTDVQNSVFPTADCGDPTQSAGLIPSSWHGTRVVGVLGALTNNGTGIAGMSWGPWILPVRALGKCGGYDSDIIAGIEWAAGMPVTPPPQNPSTSSTAIIPDNPYPADIINLSVGGSGTCPSAYQDALTAVTRLGVLVVASAGNGGTAAGQPEPVETPANCSVLVPGVIAVAGLRNVGTKVGYSSFGAEVSISAPAGNCVNNGLPCLRAIDTTTNLGTTVPAANGYTDEMHANLGTSFSAPIVSGIAALMRSVNNNLTPAQLAARLAASAMPFPTGAALPAGVPTCSAATTGECACPNDGSQCGAGMVNALQAVQAAQRPIGVIVIPATVAPGSVIDASRSVAACDTSLATPAPLSIASYSWTAAPASIIVSGAATAQVTVNPAAKGILTLTITDSGKNVDVETVVFGSASSASSSAATFAGTSATACPAALSVSPSAPTIAESFSPASVGEHAVSNLVITLSNSNGFTLIQSSIGATLPGNLLISTTIAPSTTCSGTGMALTHTTTSVKLSGATIPAEGSCTINVPVSSAAAGSYPSVIPAQALSTVPAGGNSAAASATLTVTTPSGGGGGGGGGALEWLDLLCLGGMLLAGRRRRPNPLESAP